MKNKNNEIKDSCYLGDFPLIVITGAAGGFFFVGALFATLFALCAETEAGDLVWSWTSVLHGLFCIGMGAIVSAIGIVYKKLITNRYGIIMPAMSAFGLIPAVLAFFSAAMVSVSMYPF